MASLGGARRNQRSWRRCEAESGGYQGGAEAKWRGGATHIGLGNGCGAVSDGASLPPTLMHVA